MSLELCIDPVDCAFPGLVNELLNQAPDTADRQISLAASITPQGYAYFLHVRTLYIWNYFKKGKERLPHSYRLNLPPTGLKHSISAVALIHRSESDNALPSVIAVSPEGTLRYWANPSVPGAYLEKEVGIANDVVLSVVPFDQEDHVDRYLLSTTTGSFYIIDIFKERLPEMGNKAGNNIVTRQVTFTRNSFTERFTKVLFGSGETKQSLVKTLVADRLFNDADVVTFYQSTIEFYSTKRNVVTETIDVTDYILRDLLETEASLNPSEAGLSFDRLSETSKIIRRKRSVYIADAIRHNGGLLLLVAAAKPERRNLTFALVHLTPASVTAKSTNWIDMLVLPEQYGIPETTQLRASLYTPSPGNFVIVFPTMVVSLENIESTTGSRICDISKFTDQLIGSACVGTFVQVIMKRSGICNVRHLPRGFDTTFWQKFGSQFDAVFPNPKTAAEAVAKVFTLFASKNLPEARAAYVNLKNRFPDDTVIAETVVALTKKMLDAKPSTDPRWNQDAPIPPTGAETSRSTSVMTHVDDKLAYYKMIIMFLRYFGYIESFTTQMKTFGGRSPLAVMVEFGEKVFAMNVVINMTHELYCPTVDAAIRDLGAAIQRSLSMTDNNFLMAKDYFAKEVTSFPALIPLVLKKQNREIEDKGALTGKVLSEVAQMFVAIIESTNAYLREDWTIKPGPDEQVLTNNPEFLTHFSRQFNLVFDFLESGHATVETESLLNAVNTIGRFVLSKQSHLQRNRSAIIQRFYDYGKVDVALRLAEEYLDFATLIQHCYRELPEIERRYQLEKYKTQFKSEEFDLYLYEYYKEHGLITDLLEQRGDRVEHFLSKHHEINWIRNVEKKEYGNAKTTLKTIAYSAPNAKKKKTVLALAKLAALCEDEVDHEEVGQITNAITLLEHQEKINPNVVKSVNPTNAPLSIEGIVNANLSGGDKESFLKALIALTAVIDKREFATDMDKIDTLRTRIWSTIIEADKWQRAMKKSPMMPAEDFEAHLNGFYAESKLGEILHLLSIYELPNNLKRQLLPQSTTPLKKLYHFNDSEAQTNFANLIDNVFGDIRRFLDSENENPTA
uniref:Nucleoporin_C domain-containing protein n=1 Tax=Panagrellus redivivus TaxID=6233 RepID=A0A7E4ZXC3_PANRE